MQYASSWKKLVLFLNEKFHIFDIGVSTAFSRLLNEVKLCRYNPLLFPWSLLGGSHLHLILMHYNITIEENISRFVICILKRSLEVYNVALAALAALYIPLLSHSLTVRAVSHSCNVKGCFMFKFLKFRRKLYFMYQQFENKQFYCLAVPAPPKYHLWLFIAISSSEAIKAI